MTDMYDRLHRCAAIYDEEARTLENAAQILQMQARELRTKPLVATPIEADYISRLGLPGRVRIVEHAVTMPE